MHSHKGRHNAASLFGIERIPCDNQIRNLLDPVAAAHVFGTFDSVHGALKVAGALESYQCFEGGFLLALDGTEYFSSGEDSLPDVLPSHPQRWQYDLLSCRCAADVGGTGSSAGTPFGTRVYPRLLHGHDKQDCENSAAKRWMAAHALKDDAVAVTLLGDDLYCNQPICEAAVSHRFHFIFVCKRSSHLFTLRLD